MRLGLEIAPHDGLEAARLLWSGVDIHEAFLKLACSLVCWNTLKRAEPDF
jgi:hypothetical protein